MVMGGDGRWAVVGVTSFGWGCAEVVEPDINTRVSHYIKWIQDSYHTICKLINCSDMYGLAIVGSELMLNSFIVFFPN